MATHAQPAKASYSDLRDFLTAIEAKGELERISGASCNFEMGAIVELIYREGKNSRPAVLFDEIPGYPKGFQTLYGTIGSISRIAKALGLNENEVQPMQLHHNLYARSKQIAEIPPSYVTTGPVMENVFVGDAVDLMKFPTPTYHEFDGGRYFGTHHAVIQQDPDEGWANLAPYRIMLVDKNTLALHIPPGKHGHIMMHQKYFARNKTMPVVVAIGIDPALFWYGCSPAVPWGTSEYNLAGGAKGEPIEVIRGQFTGIPFPARAEIVVEGEVNPTERVEEGPFGEWHGYYANRGLLTIPEPVIHVKAVYHRTNPILTCSQPAVPPHTFSQFTGIDDSVAIRRKLEQFGIPGIKGVWSHNQGLFIVVAIEQMYSGHAKQVGLIASQYPFEMGGYTVVVEEDIDPSNLEQVVWAMVTRCRIEEQVQILTGCHTSYVNPTVALKDKALTGKPLRLTRGRIVIDACRDLSWKDDWYPIARMTPELRSQVVEKWKTVLQNHGVPVK